jgi:DNA-binding XRE family transcriptional regulator
MNAVKRKKLEAAGFRVGDAEDFLDLKPDERELVDLRLSLSRLVRLRREKLKLTQQQLAIKIKSSQSRIAKLESGAGGVSLDLMIRGLLAVGGKLAVVVVKHKKTKPGGKAGLPAKRARAAGVVREKTLSDEGA